MATKFFTNIHENPIIAAVNQISKLEKALKSPIKNVFLLSGNILNIGEIVEECKQHDKGVFVHIDLIDGIAKDKWSLEYIAENIKPDGIITTKSNLIKLAKKFNLFTIQRLFILDSLSLETGIKLIKSAKPDAVEVLPGIMPKIIKTIHEETRIPIIAGGLIRDKEDVIESLNAGTLGISTSNTDVWYM
ncbi:glycerol-3-phosphate responsive antiterminator [Clostridium sp. D2Q-14]|uniref:glycerol-3-phosphate responsive antiterminator n=1 Tax=Anaeromonas gelatinilytica TaxID=2683194 RepID=UPI00193C7D87|nr:glycerol-3-phosphate responsive antiterminator [Anaeromonas gelatinilytica]MBS4535109.1 glycerol-3-phosphate responsive antiterminator [Anaeromonas gelatinilytica]